MHNMLLVLLLERHNTSIELFDCAAAEVGLAHLLVVMVTVVAVIVTKIQLTINN